VGTVNGMISQAQRERLFYIEFRLRFFGVINRQDMELRFEVRPAAATRDFRLYKELAPGNLVYDAYRKAYIATEAFKPSFDISSEQAITGLCLGLGDDAVARAPALLSSDSPRVFQGPHLDTLERLSRAVYQQTPVQIRYYSISNGLVDRQLVPHAFIDCGARWYVRGFDRQQGAFRDFVINRIVSTACDASAVMEREMQNADGRWQGKAILELEPHPALKHPGAVAAEYRMSAGVLRLKVRQAMAGYLLNLWRVDCSPGKGLDPHQHPLALRNADEVCDLIDLDFAPGYHNSLDKE